MTMTLFIVKRLCARRVVCKRLPVFPRPQLYGHIKSDETTARPPMRRATTTCSGDIGAR